MHTMTVHLIVDVKTKINKFINCHNTAKTNKFKKDIQML